MCDLDLTVSVVCVAGVFIHSWSWLLFINDGALLFQLLISSEVMSEFRIHHDVNELLGLLNVRGGDGAEVYIDLLQKNRTAYPTTTVSAHSAKVNINDVFHLPLHVL